MKVVAVTPANRHLYQPGLDALQHGISYPLGDDRFQLDHGPDYWAFFDRMGPVTYYVALEQDQVIASGCGVLRQVPYASGQPARAAWYCCDLKVRKDRRGAHVPFRLFASAIHHYARCTHGYLISMNPGDGADNSVVRLMKRFRGAPLSVPCTLEFHSLDAEQMRAVTPLVTEHRGPIGFLSHSGVKDIVLDSTGAPMPLLHVQWGPTGEPRTDQPKDQHVHMFCSPSQDPLAIAMRELGYAPSATATVMAHRMADADWRFILTSDI